MYQSTMVQWLELIGLCILLTHLIVTFLRLDYRRLDKRYNLTVIDEWERQRSRSRNRF